MNHEDDASFAPLAVDADLLARLRTLPRQMTPPAAGWERLQASLPARRPPLSGPAPASALSGRRRRWAVPVGAALAASLALYWMAPLSTSQQIDAPAAPTVLQQQANAMTDEYRQAMAVLPEVDAPEWQPALHELDASAGQIRDALAQSPRSRHLLEQLQRTYALRLELTRQAALSAAGLAT